MTQDHRLKKLLDEIARDAQAPRHRTVSTEEAMAAGLFSLFTTKPEPTEDFARIVISVLHLASTSGEVIFDRANVLCDAWLAHVMAEDAPPGALLDIIKRAAAELADPSLREYPPGADVKKGGE